MGEFDYKKGEAKKGNEMALSAKKFAENVVSTTSKSKLVKSVSQNIFEDVVVKIRIVLKVKEMFIDVYYNSETGKVSYALIQKWKRVFGADNLEFWHLHPFENPNEHRKTIKITFKKFLKEIEERFK